MIPLHLKISGIYSYRIPQEIDFRTLSASHLFGIFGPVGSGKSTLLEAIIYALYGETDRLNNREMRAYNMMNLKSNEAFIQFDFQAPGNKGDFRVLAKGKRNSRNKEDVKFERTAYRLEPTGIVPVDVAEIPAVLGISYDHFRRTIIIPQGKFQEFLQLGVKDRTEMVRELFNLQRFDLSFKTGRLQKMNDEAISLCLGKLQQIGDISEENLVAHQQELQGLMTQLQKSEKILKEQESVEKELRALKDLFSVLGSQREEFQKLEGEEPLIKNTELFLEEYDECVASFKSSLELLDEKKRQTDSEISALAAMKGSLVKASEEAVSAESRFNEARQAFNNRDQIKKQADELKICADINAFKKETASLLERISKGDEVVEGKNRNQESLKAQAVLLKANYETLKTQLPPLDKLKTCSEWFSSLNLINIRINDQKEKEAICRKFILESDTAIHNYWKTAGNDNPGNPDDLVALSEQLVLLKRDRQSALKNLEDRLMHLEVEEKLRSFTGNLEEGKPCPLCGSTEHPMIMKTRDTSEEQERLKSEKSGLVESIRVLENAFTGLDILRNDRSVRKDELSGILKTIEGFEKEKESLQDKNPWEGVSEEELKVLWERYNTIQKELEDLEKLITEAQVKAEEAFNLSRRYQEELAKLREQLLVKNQNISNLRQQLSQINPDEYTGTTPEAILEKVDELTRQYTRCEEVYQQREKELQIARDSKLTLEGAIGKANENLQGLSQSVEALTAQLEEKIKKSRFVEVGKVKEILASSFDRQKDMEKVRTFRSALEALKRSMDQLEIQLQGKSYDPEAHEQLKARIADLRSSLDQLREKKGGLENELEKLKLHLEESRKFTEELKKLEVRKSNLKTLMDLFRAQGFVNYISTRYLANLVTSANERFYRLTRQQLKLELDEENNFRIRDYLNDGQWRNVKTLSGGQTFQASLCLALALADNIQQLNQGGQNFFFLDEGFGTLDRESLDLVFDTLKSLRKENRIVGVISHVEEMQQEITSWLKISRDDDKGSVISTSW